MNVLQGNGQDINVEKMKKKDVSLSRQFTPERFPVLVDAAEVVCW